MDAITFDDLMSEATTKYESLPLTTRSGKTVQLRSLVMLPTEGRKTAEVLLKALDAAEGDTETVEATLRDFLAVVADNAAVVRAEVKDYPLAVLMVLVERYTGSTQPGEASGSAA